MKNKSSKYNKKIEKELRNKIILVTGGAGSIGTILVNRLLEYPVNSVRVLDINEHALFTMKQKIKNTKLRLLLGSILDKERVEMAGKDVDIIFHLAAVKNIEISEFNPIETIDTNINGTVNMIKMAMKNQPKKFLNISTDKAVESSTLYGATTLLGERLATWAGLHSSPTKFGTVRFGNIFEAKGNVFEVWEEQVNNKKSISITHPNMERYFFHAEEAVSFILNCLSLVNYGETFVPKMKSHKIQELADKYSTKQKIIGLRKGEKLNEVLLSDDEKKRAKEDSKMWIIKPLN